MRTRRSWRNAELLWRLLGGTPEAPATKREQALEELRAAIEARLQERLLDRHVRAQLEKELATVRARIRVAEALRKDP